MQLRTRVLIGLAGAALWLLVVGFMLFASAVMREPRDEQRQADGILVLTGTEQRIVEGARLLRDGRGKRMLISGVNKRTRREDVHRLSGLADHLWGCCVDLGYAALDTLGNAEEAREWASALGYRSLIVVTSNYHMPRSLAVLRMAMPDTLLLAHSVPFKSQRPSAWWLHVGTTRVLVSEYLKFLPVAARLTMARLVEPERGRRADAVVQAQRPQLEHPSTPLPQPSPAAEVK